MLSAVVRGSREGLGPLREIFVIWAVEDLDCVSFEFSTLFKIRKLWNWGFFLGCASSSFSSSLLLLPLLSVSLIPNLSYKEIMEEAQSAWSQCPPWQRYFRENRTVWSISRGSKAV